MLEHIPEDYEGVDGDSDRMNIADAENHRRKDSKKGIMQSRRKLS